MLLVGLQEYNIPKPHFPSQITFLYKNFSQFHLLYQLFKPNPMSLPRPNSVDQFTGSIAWRYFFSFLPKSLYMSHSWDIVFYLQFNFTQHNIFQFHPQGNFIKKKIDLVLELFILWSSIYYQNNSYWKCWFQILEDFKSLEILHYLPDLRDFIFNLDILILHWSVFY